LASLTKNSEDEAIVSLPDVKASTLQKVIEYCKFHNATSATDKEKKALDEIFLKLDQADKAAMQDETHIRKRIKKPIEVSKTQPKQRTK